MIVKKKLLSEIGEKMYQALVYIEFIDTTDITHVIQLIRALPEVTVVNNRSDKEDLNPRGYISVKLITKRTGVEAFATLKTTALSKVAEVRKFNYVPENIRRIESF